jgi:hypothetical protein
MKLENSSFFVTDRLPHQQSPLDEIYSHPVCKDSAIGPHSWEIMLFVQNRRKLRAAAADVCNAQPPEYGVIFTISRSTEMMARSRKKQRRSLGM